MLQPACWDAAENGAAAVDIGDEELDVAAWGEPDQLDLGDEEAANGDLLDEDGHVETGLEGADEEGGWEMEVGAHLIVLVQFLALMHSIRKEASDFDPLMSTAHFVTRAWSSAQFVRW